jgi:isoleucyl-tRNA synthetase
MAEDSVGRRSAQGAMYRIAEAFVRWIAPILSFTADEMWQFLPGERVGNVLFATWYDGLAPLASDAPLSAADFDALLALRDAASKMLEPMRAAGAIGASLEAEIVIPVDAATEAKLRPAADELRFFFITSAATLTAGEGAIAATATTNAKCIRCWHYRADVGSHAEHPEICARCVDNVDGPGEDRRWF